MRAEVRTALVLGEECLRLAQRARDPLLLPGHFVLGIPTIAQERSYRPGNTSSKASHCTMSTARLSCFLYGHDSGRVSAFGAFTLWTLGYPDHALRRIHEALSWPGSCPTPTIWRSPSPLRPACINYAGRSTHAREQAEAAIALSTEQGFPFWAARTMMRGWALAAPGHGGDGECPDPPGDRRVAGHGGQDDAAHFLALLVEAYGKEGWKRTGGPHWMRHWRWSQNGRA